MAASGARRYQLRHRAHDAGSRAAGVALSFPAEEDGKSERHIEKLWGRKDWVAAGSGWQGLSSELQLTGWSRARRVVILRRQLRETVAVSDEKQRTGQRVFTGYGGAETRAEPVRIQRTGYVTRG